MPTQKEANANPVEWPHWHKAELKEIADLIKQGTLEIVSADDPNVKGKKLYSTKLVLKRRLQQTVNLSVIKRDYAFVSAKMYLHRYRADWEPEATSGRRALGVFWRYSAVLWGPSTSNPTLISWKTLILKNWPIYPASCGYVVLLPHVVQVRFR